MPGATASGREILIFADDAADEGGLPAGGNRTAVCKLRRAARVAPDATIDPDRRIAFPVPGIRARAHGTEPTWCAKARLVAERMSGIGSGGRIVAARVLEPMGIPARRAGGSSVSLDPERPFPPAQETVRMLHRPANLERHPQVQACFSDVERTA